jgi:hypothetical protein
MTKIICTICNFSYSSQDPRINEFVITIHFRAKHPALLKVLKVDT